MKHSLGVRRLSALGVSFFALHTATAVGQDAAPESVESDQTQDVIIVRGVRGAQEQAIDTKRDGAQVLDAIAAEDIGKLPDVTIADSLQRVTGVQIRRSAGEGATVNVRGLPQVSTLLNGEQFLSAGSITSTQPNFTDIPSQLFLGASVYKSPTADQLVSGITGTINLQTRRPFDLDNGFNAAGGIEGSYGSVTEQWDPSLNGLVGFRGDRWGVLVSGAYSDLTLNNQYAGLQYGGNLHDETYQDATRSDGFVGAYSTGAGSPPSRAVPVGSCDEGTGAVRPCGFDVNGDGDANDMFFGEQSHLVRDQATQRQRLGLNASFQADLGGGFELVADGFYTNQDEYNRTVGFQFQSVNWQGATWTPRVFRDTGLQLPNYNHAGSGGELLNFYTTQVYDYNLPNFDSYSENNVVESQSSNFNVELNYDDGGPLTWSGRFIYGTASQDQDNSYLQFSLTDGVQWQPTGVGSYPSSLGGDRAFNPNGYRVNTLPASIDYTGETPVYTLPSELLTQLEDPARYALKTTASENNYERDSDLFVARWDGSYTFEDGFSIDAGIRYSQRDTTNYAFERLAPFYGGDGARIVTERDESGAPVAFAPAPEGCLVKWKAFDVSLNSGNVGDCQAPDGDGGFYTAGFVRPATQLGDGVRYFTGLADISGIPGLYVFDPKGMDDVEEFQNTLYPGNVEVEFGGRSYGVDISQWSGYLQGNFEGTAGVPYSGNAGVKIIQTKLDVTQTTTGDAVPYAGFNRVGGEVVTDRDFVDVLPSFNVAFDLTERLKLRMAYAKTMTLLDLNQWGGGLNLSYAIDTTFSPPIFRVNGGSQDGDPELDPWRADNYDVSLEYYLGEASLINVGYFYIDVDSFIESGTITRSDLPDLDGEVRGRQVAITSPIQGDGSALKGIEASWRQAFSDILPSENPLSYFGFDVNYTYSPSDTDAEDLDGNAIPFQDNSAHQSNVVAWFQGGPLQARVAYNFRSKRAGQSDYAGIPGFQLYQEPTHYLDASASYDVSDNLTVYLQGSNLTEENEQFYATFEDQFEHTQLFERRIIAGIRGRF
ncbi:TonB-dependent receptor [Parvularcula dongshanensis]|uniref:TonB-dependent receptor n=1 Tax=Parvularcula dongshanensis TaxID=1173995 RepID=A0A840I5Z7_9PROT|nr:TonB-dependent receptor [Parvularcula dongshanensis]MBB4660366.1 TonB-dependent receptor [Parvularcula dongshanensis]